MTRITQQPSRLSTSINTRTSKRTDPFYKTSQWRAFAAWIVRLRGKICQICGARLVCKRVFVDHIVELQDGGAPFDETNVQVLCGSCHTKKTLRVRGERLR